MILHYAKKSFVYGLFLNMIEDGFLMKSLAIIYQLLDYEKTIFY